MVQSPPSVEYIQLQWSEGYTHPVLTQLERFPILTCLHQEDVLLQQSDIPFHLILVDPVGKYSRAHVSATPSVNTTILYWAVRPFRFIVSSMVVWLDSRQ